MHSTGEVMGVGATFGEAYGKAMEGAGIETADEREGVHLRDERRQRQAVILARRLNKLGFDLVATYGTANRFAKSVSSANRLQSKRRASEHRRLSSAGRHRDSSSTPTRQDFALRREGDPQSRAAVQCSVRDDDHRAEALVEAISTKKSQEHVTVRSFAGDT
jgi:carbamoyl-phosphate synthase large subunit